tara:strand:+ start:69 stop:596 length:528 start_codon:yes stop_codon:yes gene_type:complete
MAKTDSFFIRQKTTCNGTNFVQEAIDLGAFVDALGKSVLKIHSVSVQWKDADATNANFGLPAANSPGTGVMSWQLTTQSQSQLLYADDKSLISSGVLELYNSTNTGGIITGSDDTIDLQPQMWKNGYIVAVDTMYLGAQQSVEPSTGNLNCTVVLECTVETMTKEAAMALALSQQ